MVAGRWKGAQRRETSVCRVLIEPHRLSWILTHIKRPVILGAVLQGEGPPCFVLPQRRDAAQRNTDPARRFRAFLRTMPGSFALKNGAQDDRAFDAREKGERCQRVKGVIP